MEFSKEELQFLLVIVRNQLDIQKLYNKKLKKKKNGFFREKDFEETEKSLKFLAVKIESFLKDN